MVIDRFVRPILARDRDCSRQEISAISVFVADGKPSAATNRFSRQYCVRGTTFSFVTVG